jgi:putative SOS response-associated peptidase YedK
MVDGPADIADRTRARAVIDFDPGSRTVARTGAVAVGAVQGSPDGNRSGAAELFSTGTVCRPGRPVVDRVDRLGHMCGRYATTRSSADLAAFFEADDDTGGVLAPDYNVAPTDPVPVVRGRPRLRLSVARWGLVPAWAAGDRGAGGSMLASDRSTGGGTLAGDHGAGGGTPAGGRSARHAARMINARAETLATARAFARAFRRRRCLVPADGWYEWRRTPDGRRKQAYFMTPRDGSVLVFAGLSATSGATSEATSGAGVLTCSIVTTAAVGDLALVHDRMPLLLPPERWDDWLGYGAAGAAVTDGHPGDHAVQDPAVLLAASPAGLVAGLEIRPVGPAVGDVRNDGPELVRRVTPQRDFDVDPTDLTLF